MTRRGRDWDEYEDMRAEAAWERRRERNRCRAPSCLCESPCDDYQRDEEEEEEPYGVYAVCPHCGEENPWSWNAPLEERVCCSCDRGDLIESFGQSTQHRARKEFPEEGIEPGDLYQRYVTGGYEVGGPRWLKVRKWVVQKASDLEKIAAVHFAKGEE